MKKTSFIRWEFQDLEEISNIYANIGYDTLRLFYNNYNNISSFGGTVDGYKVDFKSEIIDDNIVVIYFKTSYINQYKELFRFYKSDNFNGSKIQTRKILLNCHILYNFFLKNEKFELFISNTEKNDKDPDEIFDYQAFPQFLNGGYDYFKCFINQEIISDEDVNNKNLNMKLYGTCINFDDKKIDDLFDVVNNFFISNDDIQYPLAKGLCTFYNDKVESHKINVRFDLENFTITRIADKREYTYGGFILTENNISEKIEFPSNLFASGYGGIEKLNEDFKGNNTIIHQYVSIFNSINNINFKNYLTKHFVFNYVSDRNISLLQIQIYYMVYIFISIIKENEYVIPEFFINTITNLINDITKIVIDENNYDIDIDTELKITKSYIIIKLFYMLYTSNYHIYTKCIASIYNKLIPILLNLDNRMALQFFLQPFRHCLNKYDLYFNIYTIKQPDTFLRFLYCLTKLLEDDILNRNYRYLYDYVKANAAYKEIVFSEYKVYIYNIMMSKNYSNNNYIFPYWCGNILSNYSDYNPRSVAFNYEYNGKEYFISKKESKYDINLINSVNLLLNAIIKNHPKKSILAKSLQLADTFAITVDFRIPPDEKLLSNVSFFILNADKYESNLVNKLYDIGLKINKVYYPAICSSGISKIPHTFINKLFPKFWGNKVQQNHLIDIEKIIDTYLKPEPGMDNISKTIYKDVNSRINKYIDENI